ncbi:MAG: efflux RND transporter permease subunit [Pirellulales bacterium]|nr:efflux RND transporter permease subunit [Pirellulales bacterium]
MIRAIIDLALRNRLLILLLALLVAIGGIICYQRMPKDIYPDLNAPLVNIIASYHGMAAEDVERLVTYPLESLMSGSPGVTRVRSESTTGESVVTVEFDWGTDIYQARQIVAGKLEILAEQLPGGAGRPSMGPVSSRMGEIFEFAVVGDAVDPMELRGIADWTIHYRLLGVEGVSFVVNLGGFARQYQVFLKPEMLHHYRITVKEVQEAIENSNRNFSGGIITKKHQEFLVKGLGRIESIEDIRKTVITSHNGIPVYVQDVADVAVGHKFPRGHAGYNGKDAVSVVVQKQYGSDTLRVIDNIKTFLANIKRDLPDGVDVIPYYDQSELIHSVLSHVEISMVEGGILVLIVILIFLGNLRASLIAALTIPISVLFALNLMYLGNVSLSVMALGGLAIGIGKMASGSVIMVENIYKAMESGKEQTALGAAMHGAGEVGPYLFSANVIIVLVFLPLLGFEGIAGRMFRPTAFALVAALLGSLVINITLQPVLMSYCMGRRDLQKKENWLNRLTTRAYASILKISFHLKAAVILAYIAVLVIGFFAYREIGSEFVPFLDEGTIIGTTVMLPETSLEESIRIGKKVEKLFLSFPEVVSVCRTTGMGEETEHVHPANHSHYIMKLKPVEERTRGYIELTQAMRRELDKNVTGAVYMFEQPIANKLSEMLTGVEGQISLKLFGPDLEVLNAKIEEIQQVMEDVPGIADLQIEQTSGIPLILIDLDREALARYGIHVGDVADLIETAMNGIEVTDVREGERLTSVLIRLPDKYRHHVEEISNILVDAPAGNQVPLSQLAAIKRGEGPQTIFREDLTRRKIILCNVVGRDVGSFVKDVTKKINQNVGLPKGYHFAFGGQFESQQKTMRQLMWMMLIVGLSVLVVLFASLGSLRQSFLLLLNVPITLAGGVVALYLAGQTLNVSSIIGFIALFGIALQNGVVLVGKINDLHKQGLDRHDAVIQGSINRFRPILMTELILILGVLPLAMRTTLGSEMHRPLAVVYIGGFIAAIFFEQIVLPILYEPFTRNLADRRSA